MSCNPSESGEIWEIWEWLEALDHLTAGSACALTVGET